MQEPKAKIEIFFSYAHEDEKLRNELEKRLGNLKRQGLIAGWHDRKIGPGKEWEHEINAHLNTSHIILLLVSPDFMVSDYCTSIELKRAMERYKNREALVIPVILRPTDWEDSLFGKLQALPTGAKPVTRWQTRDEAFLDIAKGIRKAIDELTTKSIADLSLFESTSVNPNVDFKSSTNLGVDILNGLADMAVRLGGHTVDGKLRWRFCCILVPKNPRLPLQQSSLVLQAKTRDAPSEYKVGTTVVSPDEPIISISLRAFQSGRVIYRHMITPEDTSIAYRKLEEPIGSAVAVPIGAEDGYPVAVLYVTSAEADAFKEGDLSLLRVIGRIIEELLLTNRIRVQVTGKFTNLVKNPGVVDPTFDAFASENEFISDVEDLLGTIDKLAEGKERIRKEDYADHEEALKKAEQSPDAVSFIAIGIDDQVGLANKYGDHMAKNLSREVGLRIQRQLRILFTNANCKLYHIYADRFYLLLKGISLEQTRIKAELLRQILKGTYYIYALRSSVELPAVRENMLVLSDITVRLGVASYLYTKLDEILQRYHTKTKLVMASSTAAILNHNLDDLLKAGLDRGGNVVISWDLKIWGYVKWSPPE